MRAEDAGAATWLCAALAGWALCVWILAMFGMGGSIDRLDDDPALRQALPAPSVRGDERLGPLAQYGDVVARPLFSENRRPQAFVIDPTGDPGETGNDFDYVLTSVVRTPEFQLVILQPSGGGEPVRVKQGEAPTSAPGWVLQSVAARRAVFAGPQGERTLELRVFDGVGGEAPTAMAQAPGGQPAEADPMATEGPVPAVVIDANETAGPQAPKPGVAGPGRPQQTASGPTGEAQSQAAQEQVEAIRRRIEERRARLRQEEMARTRADQQSPQDNK